MSRILIPTALSACLLLSACGGWDGRSQTQLAREAATETLDAYAAGEYARAWDGLDSASRAAISRADWVRLYTVLCRPDAEGIRFVVEKVRVKGQKGTARTSRGGSVVFTWPMVREGGAWHLQLETGMLHDFTTFTVEELATSWAQDGLCQQTSVVGDDDLDVHLYGRRSPAPKASASSVSALPRPKVPTAKASAPATAKAVAPAPQKAVVKAPAAPAPAPAVKAPAAPAPVKAPVRR